MHQPTLFVSHSAPDLALDKQRGERLTALGHALGMPKAILIVSAHWCSKEPLLGTTSHQELIYDFSGFSPRLRKIKYRATRAPMLADDVLKLLKSRFPKAGRMESRGLDHGAWVPLLHLYPSALIPVLQLSLPTAHGVEGMVALGETLTPLADRDVLLICSGSITHNLTALSEKDDENPSEAARQFEAWIRSCLKAGEWQRIVHHWENAPGAAHAHPHPDHLWPLFVALGAARKPMAVSFPVQGWDYGEISQLCIQFRSA